MERFTKLIDHIYRLRVPFEDIFTSVFLIRTPAGDALLDAATTARDADEFIIPALEELGVHPAYLLISHDHGDHSGGMPAVAARYPDAVVGMADEAAMAKFPQNKTLLLREGAKLLNCLTVWQLVGHSTDSIGIFDARTNTLLSGDCLQLGGVSRWGTGLAFPKLYLETIDRLRGEPVENIIASHEYCPLGALALGRCRVNVYLNECVIDVKNIREHIGAHPGKTPEELAAGFNASHPGHPPISAYTVKRFVEGY